MKKRLLAGFLSVCMMAGLIAYPADVSVVRAEATERAEGTSEAGEIPEVNKKEPELPDLEEQELVSVGDSEGYTVYTYEDYAYIVLDDDTIEITDYSGSDSDISIPDTIDGKVVTSIGKGAFSYCYSLRSITISDSVTSIGEYAFYFCLSLTSITIPDSVTSIGERAFSGCESLTSITIPDSVTSIEERAFSGCLSLTSITIPDSVTSIGEHAFSYCRSLTSINVLEGNASYSSENGILYNKEMTELICCPGGIEGNFNIPEGVTSIGEYAFSDCESLTSITIPDSVTSIGEYAFSGCSSLTIYCYKDSVAHTYAIEYEILYKLLDNANDADDTTEDTHTHHYTGKVTKKATCTEAGVKTYTCSCGDTYTEAIPAAGHTYTTTTNKATTSKNGSITKKCSVCGNVASKTTIYYPKTITLSKTSYTYNGKAQKPTVTVKDSKGKQLKKGTDYTVTYSKGCKNVGQYTVTIKFKGNYSGTVKKTFTIAPKSTSLSKLTAKKKGFTAKWKKLTSQTTGYEIQYSTSSKFTTKTTKTVAISKNKTTSKTISKLKAKKKYYVRIRTYKTVKVNGKSTKIYSGWSKTKAVTTKK